MTNLKIKIVLGLKVLMGIFLFFICLAIFYWCNNRLFLVEARMMWPQMEFNEISFKSGSVDIRSSMVVDLIEKKYLLTNPAIVFLRS